MKAAYIVDQAGQTGTVTDHRLVSGTYLVVFRGGCGKWVTRACFDVAIG